MVLTTKAPYKEGAHPRQNCRDGKVRRASVASFRGRWSVSHPYLLTPTLSF